jgi:competence protein ComFC
MKPLKEVFSAVVDFIYPSACIHCGAPSSYNEGPLCNECAELLELINPIERCPYCFSSDYDQAKKVCYPCFMETPTLQRCAAVFDYEGPAASIVSRMKYSRQPWLAEGAGAYLALQWLTLDWPKPDIIVPVPLTFLHRLTRGYNQSLLLSQSMGKIIDAPVREILKRGILDFSQAGMTRKQRLQLDADSFSLKRHINIMDKTILLVDDVSTTGKTMACCAEALYAGYPKAVYGISLCQVIL